MEERPTVEVEEAEGDGILTLPLEFADFADVFDLEKAAELAPLTGRAHAIDLEGDEPPLFGPLYPCTGKELEVLKEYLRNTLERGWIRLSTSLTGAPVIFIPKKGGDLRVCIDYRALNKVTRKNRTPLSLISEIFDRLTNTKVYTKLDLKDVYYRIRIRPGDEWKTAFRCHYGYFEYLVMSFRLTNCQRLKYRVTSATAVLGKCQLASGDG